MAELTAAEWQALALALARDVDVVSQQFVAELSDILRDVERRLPALIARAQSGSAAASMDVARLGALRVQLRRVLREAGYDALVDVSVQAGLDQALARLAASNATYRRAVAFATSGRPRAVAATLRAVVEVGRFDLLAHGEALADALWRVAIRGALGATPAETLIAQLSEALDGQRARAATVYDTTISMVQRVSVQAVSASVDLPLTPRDEQLYAYIGPVDEIVRPFCREHLGRVYTQAEIEALDNGQLPNPFITGGGYNCRHLWAPLSAFDPATDLHGTTGRVEEVAAGLARLAARPRRRRRAA